MDLLNLLSIDKDMIIIYALIVVMAILLIIVFTLDAKNKKKNLDEEDIVIKGTTPLEQYQQTNNLQAKVEQKIEQLEKEQVKTKEIEENIEVKEETKEETEIIEENNKDGNIKYVEDKTIEEQQEEAQKELDKAALSLIDDKKEEDTLTNFEIEQEENAIISYNELVKVSENLYESNEKTQYEDEGNEPITIEQLREKFSDSSKEELKAEPNSELVSTIDKIINDSKKETQNESIDLNKQKENIERPKVKLDDFVLEKEPKKETKFKSSPIISPVFGIEKEKAIKEQTELELEQTADLEKLDAEIRKTNQFLQVLKELQKKLD